MTRRAGPQPSESESVAGFSSLDESGPGDWALLRARRRELYVGLADKALHHLGSMSDETFGWPISRQQHCLQAATRAQRDGARDEMVVVALMHDVFDELCPARHAEPAAAMLKPFVSREAHWILAHHTWFQLAYHDVGWRRHQRYLLRWHRHYQAAADFCARWDAPSFDTAYDTRPIEAFVPVVRKVMDPGGLRTRA